MEFHQPKPVHSWRDFVKELGTIALGVCIALAAEQGVEWYHWRSKVTLAREQIASEMTSNFEGAISRIRIGPCVERRLDALALILDAASKSGALPPVGDIGVPRPIIWSTGVWDSLVASETATHFPTGHLQNLAVTYKAIQRLDEGGRQELEEWKILYGMVGPGRRLDPASEAQLRQALGQARGSNRMLTNMSSQLFRTTKNLEIQFSPDERADLTLWKQMPLTGGKPTLYAPVRFSICNPMGPVPASYGQAPYSAFPSLMNEALKTIPDFSGAAK
ncbi:MAG: hypothetical protein JO256_03800 [Alphaproteobacteria bacterium]|nr:hypothetical protein [Alphaproteobacteria bacterium]